MRILLIAPASGDWRLIGRRRFLNGKTFRFSMLSLLSVARLCPENSEVTLIDEQMEDVPEGPFDLVGITAMTALAPRAYELCDRFRRRGIPVVMGGFHATFNTQEALGHADAVVVGPAYGAWERVCEDVQAGRLARVYQGSLDAKVPVHLPRHLLRKKAYVTLSSVAATLGCRNRCHFCSIHPFHGGCRLERPVTEVAEEIAALPEDSFIFVDDNLTQDREYALALFRAIAPLGKRWITQASLEISQDLELVEAMFEAGCRGVFVGLETFNAEALAQQGKDFNRPKQYREALAVLHRQGIYVEAGVIVGFDNDRREAFSNTLRMLEDIGIDGIQLSILTPLPGTELYRSMKSRIIDTDWEHYDFRHVVFRPKHMTAEELQVGADWMIREFYSPWRVLKRSFRWLRVPAGFKPFLHMVALNLAYWGRVQRFRIRGYDPAAQWSPGGRRKTATSVEAPVPEGGFRSG